MNKITTGATISAKYKFQVIQNGIIVQERPWAKNLILNQGLDLFCSSSISGSQAFGGFFTHHVVGTGTAAALVTDTGLGNETKRTSTYLTGAGNCGRSNTDNTVTFRRTYDHTVETSNVNYSEHGLSYTGASGNNLVTRALISGGTITILEGQQLRCVYDITVTLSPGTATALTVGGTGWPVSGVTDCTGQYIIGLIDGALGTFDTNGNAYGAGLLVGNTLTSYNCSALTNITLPSFNVQPFPTRIGSAITYNLSSYTPGDFEFTITPSAYVTASAYSTTNLQGWEFQTTYSGNGLYFKYTYPQTKANTHRLRYPSLTVTWARA